MGKISEWRTPIYVPRWILTATYGGFIALGVLAVIFGTPTINLLNPQGYTVIWGALAVLAAGVASWGSVSEKWEAVERWGNIALVLDLIFYCLNALVLVFSGDHATTRAVFTGIVIMLTALPLGRGIYLLTRTGIRHP